MRTRILLILALLLFGSVAWAQSDDKQAPPASAGEVPPPPPLPEKVPQPDIPPPTVTIRRQEGKVVEEYSVNGNVYMVRVTPKHGAPYYLLDTDGDGQLDRAPMEFGPHVNVPHWVIFEWQ